MNARNAQMVAAGLGFVLILIVGAVIFILLSRPAPGPRASATPTGIAAATFTPSPVASGLPTITPSPIPTLSPELTPSTVPTASPELTPTLEITPTPEITPTAELTPTIGVTPTPTVVVPTPSPTSTATATPLVPVAEARQLRLFGVGLDSRDLEAGGVERKIRFSVDGPSLLRVTLSNATARSRVCMWPGDRVNSQACDEFRNGSLERATPSDLPETWTVTLIGATATASPVVDVAIDFNANDPEATLSDFRFLGVPQTNYNGFAAEFDVTTAPGGQAQIDVNGEFDLNQQHSYRVLIAEEGTVVHDVTDGPAHAFQVAIPASDGLTYRVTVSNPNPESEPVPVFIQTSLVWAEIGP